MWICKLCVQYSSHLNTRLVWYSNGRFVSSCRLVRYSNGGLKTGLKKACLWSKMSCIWMVRQVKCFTIWIPDTHTVWYSDESGIQVFFSVFRWLLYLDLHCNKKLDLCSQGRPQVDCWGLDQEVCRRGHQGQGQQDLFALGHRQEPQCHCQTSSHCKSRYGKAHAKLNFIVVLAKSPMSNLHWLDSHFLHAILVQRSILSASNAFYLWCHC